VYSLRNNHLKPAKGSEARCDLRFHSDWTPVDEETRRFLEAIQIPFVFESDREIEKFIEGKWFQGEFGPALCPGGYNPIRSLKPFQPDWDQLAEILEIRTDQFIQARPLAELASSKAFEPRKIDSPNISALPIVEKNRPDAFTYFADEVAKMVADKLREKSDDSVDRYNGQLRPVYEQTYRAYEVAVTRLGQGATDMEAYQWLREYRPAEYKLPAFATFTRYLRKARRHYGAQKHRPRLGRRGRSFVHQSEFESTNQPD